MKIVFFSDTHLDATDEGKTRIVETFIREVCGSADIAFLMGDIFEFYHGHRGYIYPWYKRVIDAIRDITKKGTAVYFLEGNHEFGVGGFLESYAGVKCVHTMTLDVEGKRLFVSHGDEFVGGAVRTILKAAFTGWVMDFLGPRLTWKVAMVARIFLSRKEKPYNRHVEQLFRDFARKKLDDGFDAVILAHSHVPDKVDYGSGETGKVYLNTGDFFAGSTYVCYETGKGFNLKTHALKI